MDLKKVKKPLHFECPNCKKEIELYPKEIERTFQRLKVEIADIKKQMELFKTGHPLDYKRNEWYIRSKKALAHKLYEYQNVKKTRTMICEATEKQLFEEFKNIVKANVGFDAFVKMIKEAEDNIQYNTYDTAIQKYSTIMSRPNNNR